MHLRLNAMLPTLALLLLGCSSGDDGFTSTNADKVLSFGGREFEIESVYCSDRMRRVTVRFEQGALYVSERDEAPGYEAILRFTAPERSEYVSREFTRDSIDIIHTSGLSLDVDQGVHGKIRLTRSMVLLHPDRFPESGAREMEVRAGCPG